MVAIRTYRFEIDFRDAKFISDRAGKNSKALSKDEIRDLRSKWQELGNSISELTNMVWIRWMLWHEQNGSRAKLRTFRNAWKVYKESGGDKPELALKSLPAECRVYIDEAFVEFPDLNGRVAGLVSKEIAGKITKGKAAKGAWPKWQEILMHREQLPSTTKMQQILFDTRISKLLEPELKGRNFRLRLNVSANLPSPGKSKRRPDWIEVGLLTRTKGARKAVPILEKILANEWGFAGSKLWFDRRKGKWFALICYKRVGTFSDLDESRVAYLRPGRYRPWYMRIDGHRIRVGDNGFFVTSKMRDLSARRLSMQRKYRYAGQGSKGHGFGRPSRDWQKLTDARIRMMTGYNHWISSQVVRICRDRGCGKLIVLVPEGAIKATRFLERATKANDRHKAGWAWFQLCSQLEYKSEQPGELRMKVEKRRSGRPENTEKAEP